MVLGGEKCWCTEESQVHKWTEMDYMEHHAVHSGDNLASL